MERARELQMVSIKTVQALCKLGKFSAGLKEPLNFLGHEVGPVFAPNEDLTADQLTEYKAALEDCGFFDWASK